LAQREAAASGWVAGMNARLQKSELKSPAVKGKGMNLRLWMKNDLTIWVGDCGWIEMVMSIV